MWIGINDKGVAVFDLSDISTKKRLEQDGADFSGIPEEIDEYMAARGITKYVSSIGFELGKYWFQNQWILQPETVWAVFNPTINDLQNSFDNVVWSLDGKRALLCKQNPFYDYQGIGSHNENMQNITPQELSHEDVIVLMDSPFWAIEVQPFDNRFLKSDSDFAKQQIEWSKTQILSAQASMEEKQAAIALVQNVLFYLSYGFLSPALVALQAVQPAGAFTIEMKNQLVSNFTAYLNKFPR